MNKELWEKCVNFHGHECGGLAIGFKAALGAIEELGLNFSQDEELLCITENDACGVDAVQVITGCTMGKGNLMYKGTGKMAFTFLNRKENKSVRLMLNPFHEDMNQKQRREFLLLADYRDVFKITYPKIQVPEKARGFQTIICDKCQEGAADHKIRMMNGQKLCLDCFEPYTRGWD
ncbi:formylmethanofuran dehydrogenase subunit E [Alkalibaculum bacchi]|uniref:Formylmethanofuran dehydrogenase subunit E n=1 Tax=Alkalibaculum bacchi TaxID=645887 RepID=A0A366IDK1_9FIRM|nr:FmdE family protein [Alkalibaculum bacchi]RBP68314.1 formylmethanofuran dehydrogenase subunit E [Alkalibaculum bacchi]